MDIAMLLKEVCTKMGNMGIDLWPMVYEKYIGSFDKKQFGIDIKALIPVKGTGCCYGCSRGINGRHILCMLQDSHLITYALYHIKCWKKQHPSPLVYYTLTEGVGSHVYHCDLWNCACDMLIRGSNGYDKAYDMKYMSIFNTDYRIEKEKEIERLENEVIRLEAECKEVSDVWFKEQRKILSDKSYDKLVEFVKNQKIERELFISQFADVANFEEIRALAENKMDRSYLLTIELIKDLVQEDNIIH